MAFFNKYGIFHIMFFWIPLFTKTALIIRDIEPENPKVLFDFPH